VPAPLLLPTCPVTWEMPVLVTAPTEVNKTKLATEPIVGVCARSELHVINTKNIAAIILLKFFVIKGRIV
jgi:hypothetical protein